MTSIILCGLPCSGKTTIGKRLAAQLHWDFIDTDQLIERAYSNQAKLSLTCRQIFAQEGEQIFRQLEKQQLLSLKNEPNRVIALGGGALNLIENRVFLKNQGQLIYLKTEIELVWQRIEQQATRPSYLNGQNPKKAFYQLAEQRLPLYESIADFTLEITHQSESEIIQAILVLMNPTKLKGPTIG